MFAESLAQHTSVPILLVDERLTTAISNQQIRQVGKSQKDARSIIDQMAAVAILEYAFQVELNSGQRPGLLLIDWKEQNAG
jgi:putative Holliday junction resolvase